MLKIDATTQKLQAKLLQDSRDFAEALIKETEIPLEEADKIRTLVLARINVLLIDLFHSSNFDELIARLPELV